MQIPLLAEPGLHGFGRLPASHSMYAFVSCLNASLNLSTKPEYGLSLRAMPGSSKFKGVRGAKPALTESFDPKISNLTS
jgi:hypothetical protein